MKRHQQVSGSRVLICGGRDYQDWHSVASVLQRLHDRSPIGLIIHGCDPGAATLAVRWAAQARVPTSGFDADFHSRPAAERLRNERMVRESKPDLVVAFPGGEGTADLISRATAAGVPVRQVRQGNRLRRRWRRTGATNACLECHPSE
jgi:predicted Rossmann-fold nucleotide-binding protein